MATTNKNFKVKNGLDVNGEITSLNSNGPEGGQLNLAKPETTDLSGNVIIDIYDNKVRFFDSSGTNRGAYIDLTAAATGVGTDLLGGVTGAMNYAQTEGTKQSAVSAAGTTIVSVSITTNGYPILVTVTGDVENGSAGGWTVLQLYRDSTAIGNPVHTEGSAGSENVPYALSVIDTPAAGTYTYALKLNNSAGGTFNFGESDGPVITAIELSGPKGDTGASGLADIVSDTTPQLGGDLDAQGYDITNLNSVTLDTTPTSPGTAAGTIYWDSGDGIPKAVLNANVTIGLGQESIITVKNATGSTITKGTVVYINGAQGQMPTIALANAATEGTSSKTFGFVAEQILDDAEGFVVTEGVLRGVNTDTFTEGDPIYLSTTAGQYTQTIPAEPAHMVFLGYAVKAHVSAGEIVVKIQNGYELTELHGVTIANTAATNDILQLNSSGIWVNANLATAGIANLSGATFTGNVAGTNLDLSGKEKFSNTGTGAPTFTTYSSGVRTVFYDNVGGTSVGYTRGIDAGVMWDSIPAADAGMYFKWYGGETQVASLSGSGTFTATTVNATTFNGSGAGLTSIPNSATTAASANGASTIVARDASGNFAGNVITATTFSGSGASLTNIPAANITGTVPAAANLSGATNVGYMGIPQNTNPTPQSGSTYTIQSSDAGKHIYMTTSGRTISIPANSTTTFEVGTTIVIINATGVTTTISAVFHDIILAGIGTTGTRTLAPFGMATLVKVATSTWVISGNGVS